MRNLFKVNKKEIVIHTTQGWTATKRLELQEKEEKDEKNIGKLSRENPKILLSIIARKETVDIDILVTFRNGDRKIMRPIGITSWPATRMLK